MSILMYDRKDLLLGLLLALVAGSASYYGASLINSVLLEAPDLWFQSDMPRVYADMTDRWFPHAQTSVHPLFLLTTFPAVYGLERAFGLEAITAVRILVAVLASVWVVGLFAILRLMGCRRLDAIVFCLLGMTSASAVFWFVVPETFGFGSVTIILALIVVALTEFTTPSQWWYVIMTALTFSVTVTNGMVGLFATWCRYPWRRALPITAGAVCLVLLLWGVERVIFPTAPLFYELRQHRTFSWVNSPLSTIGAFVFHSIVMPAITIRHNEFVPEQPYMSTQLSLPGSGSIWGKVAIGLWAALVGLGLWSWRVAPMHRLLRRVLAYTLMGQFALHLVYGDETFLYSLHYAPLLIVLVAFTALTRARPIGLGLACGLIVLAAANNGGQLAKALESIPQHLSEHLKLRDQMKQRPSAIWPRGMGHVVLAAPGTGDMEKGYHEPGGSFSPGVGSFGVSVWITGETGDPIVTSDTLPLSEIRQRFEPSGDLAKSAIVTETPYYRATWSVCEPGCWRLELSTFGAHRPVLMIRSAGPAGGPIESLDWNGTRLLVNQRWSAEIHPSSAAIVLGEENSHGRLTAASTVGESIHLSDWRYARIELGKPTEQQKEDWNIVIRDTRPRDPRPVWNSEPAASQMLRDLEAELPDPRFMASLQAQIRHVTMGLVGTETWRGDPISFRSPALRDGAYTIVALARTGHIELARELSRFMAEHDFYGDFGAEADAPGLAIWALEEVARYTRDPTYDRWLWPHVQRKADLIKRMSATNEPVRVALEGPFPKAGDFPGFAYAWDFDLVAEPSRDGFIVGRAFGVRPLLYVNAVSYQGLLKAAAMADRLGRPESVESYRALAERLQQAWGTEFQRAEPKVSMDHLGSLWPTGIGSALRDKVRRGLEARWHQLRDQTGRFKDPPRATYFVLDEAHQWLHLGDPDHVWPTLEWLWDHQVSPGLYTWAEGGEKIYRTVLTRWEGVRTLQYPHVTPLYWTAAQMILLQVDMLAYLERHAPETTIVIGPGIPSAWLSRPITVRGVPYPGGFLDWRWDGERLHVTIRGDQVKVTLGPAFPRTTTVQVRSPHR